MLIKSYEDEIKINEKQYWAYRIVHSGTFKEKEQALIKDIGLCLLL